MQSGAAVAKPRALAWLKEVSETIPLHKDRKEVELASIPPSVSIPNNLSFRYLQQ